MGKKNKKFQKKKHRVASPLHQEMAKKAAISDEVLETVKQDEPISEAEEKENETPELHGTDNYAYVKKDIIKIVIIMFSILVALFAIYYLSKTTSILNSLGDWIYKVTNINIG